MSKVTLLAYSPNPQQIVAAAAKLCYSPASVDELCENLTPEKSADFVSMLAEIGHESPIEHASFTFAIEGVSRTLLAQITRHRIASFSVQSQRYVSENQFEYVTPPEIAADPEAAREFANAMCAAQKSYTILADILEKKHEAVLLEGGEEPKQAKGKARKMAIEDARFVLPGACDTKMIVTMNARSLRNFFELRCCSRAQWEIRAVADEMLLLVTKAAPVLFKKAGPPCLSGGCPEGKMTCGKILEVREKYKALPDRGEGK